MKDFILYIILYNFSTGTEQQSQQQSATQSGSYNDLQKNDHRHSIASSGTITDNAEDDEDYENEVSPQQDPQFDYFGVASQPVLFVSQDNVLHILLSSGL